MSNSSKTLDEYCLRWSLSNPIKLSESLTSYIYKVTYNGQDAVLKIQTEVGCEDEKYAADCLKTFEGCSAVRLFKNDSSAQLLEYLSGHHLKVLVESKKDNEATNIIAKILNDLHRAKSESMNFPSLRERFTSLYDAVQTNPTIGLFKKAIDLADTLLKEERDKVVLHGDIHHENILYSDRRGWIAIDPKGLFGERTYDAANILYNPMGSPHLVANKLRILCVAETLAAELNIDLKRLLAFGFVHGCLSACWSIEDGQDPSLALNVATLIDSILSKP